MRNEPSHEFPVSGLRLLETRNRKPETHRPGLTLIELLVAFGIFVLMIAGLVAFSASNLDNWRASESRKDTYERAQILFAQVEDDLRNAFIDEEIETAGVARLRPAQFFCDQDKEGRQKLVFTRTVKPLPPAPGKAPPPLGVLTSTPLDVYAPLVEVAYLLDPENRTLWRAEQPFERSSSTSFFEPRNLDLKSKRFKDAAAVLDNGVVHVEYRFWTQLTNTWNPKFKPTFSSHRKEDSGPSLVWDSTRVQITGFFARTQKPPGPQDPADYILPEFVQVRLVLEPQARESRGAPLAQPLAPSANEMTIDDTRMIPDGPGFVRIGREWIEYTEKTASTLKLGRRGMSGQNLPTYPTGEPVHFGDPFAADVRLPAFREYRR